jgi:SSS family solute:Na+ symporter
MFGQISLVDIVGVILYMFVTAYLGWLGYKHTKSSTDYLIAGRKAHPFIMALSYGATFISTSAIVGFGGVAGLFGMSLLWLTFCNIFIGIFIAFVFLGGRTRQLGHRLDAHTFPELLGKRYQSKFIQVFIGLIIVFFMPLYGAAVLIGGTEFISTVFSMSYGTALFLFATIVAVYVIFGGLKGVMYTDTFQGCIMFIGMFIFLIFSYAYVGGVIESHKALTELKDLVPSNLVAIGHQGWTSMPKFGFGAKEYDLWWIIVSTITLGVGIGVLAQPQLAVRFMTVKSRRELNRAVLIGGIFILAMTGVAFTVGSISNVYFVKHGKVFNGKIVKVINEDKQHVLLQLTKKTDSGEWVNIVDEKTNAPKTIPAVLADPQIKLKDLSPDERTNKIFQARSIAVVNAGGNPDQIIPTYVAAAMPKWFSLIFLLTLLSAAMSTLSSQFHTIGTAAGRDVFERLFSAGRANAVSSDTTIFIVRIAILITLIFAVVFGYYWRGEYIIARATAIFFGLCAAAFMPSFICGLYFKWVTKPAVICSIVTGFVVSLFWLVLVKSQEAQAIGIVQKLTGGKNSILADYPNWPVVDPIVVALPISALVLIIVSLITKAPAEEHIKKCFGNSE